jgi:vacuolar-type H+-ATPase subunit I/STV1
MYSMNKPQTEGQTPNGDTPGQTATPQGQTTSSGSTPTETDKTPISSLPADIQDYIRRLRDEAEEANKKQRADARKLQQAEEQRLKEQGEYKQLAEAHAARVQQLEPIAERYEALSKLVTEQIDDETKDWPQTVKALDPGADAGIETRLAWRNKARAIVADLQQQARGQQPGNSPNPKPASGTSPDTLARTFENRLRSSGKYGA